MHVPQSLKVSDWYSCNISFINIIMGTCSALCAFDPRAAAAANPHTHCLVPHANSHKYISASALYSHFAPGCSSHSYAFTHTHQPNHCVSFIFYSYRRGGAAAPIHGHEFPTHTLSLAHRPQEINTIHVCFICVSTSARSPITAEFMLEKPHTCTRTSSSSRDVSWGGRCYHAPATMGSQ